MHTPFAFFDKIYCINLKRRTDRWIQVQTEFAKLNITVDRFEAIEGNDPKQAFNMSQVAVLQQALRDGCRRFLVLEDDVVFTNTAHLTMSLKQLPYNWDMLYLGANVLGDDCNRWAKPVKISNNLCRVFNAWQTHSVAYNRKVAEVIVSQFNPLGGEMYDDWLRRNILVSKLCYITYPQMTYQAPGFSDIWNTQTDYTSLLKRGNNAMSA
jgi:GR25 family glycosyltransferase involved in LPS biosynthesis